MRPVDQLCSRLVVGSVMNAVLAANETIKQAVQTALNWIPQ